MRCSASRDAKIKAGQLCGKIDPRPFEAAGGSRKGGSGERSATARQERKHALLRAQKDFERRQDLGARGAKSRAALDRSRVIYERAKARAAADEADVAKIQKALAAAQNDLALTDIFSPVDGTVISRNAEAGQQFQVNQEFPLFVIAPNSAATPE